MNATHPPPRGLVIGAFAAVYLVWGSTYLAIRYAVETLPPFLMGGARFLAAGLILFGILRARGVPVPGWTHWRNATLVGAVLLGLGNGAVNWAERGVPSGVTALLIAVTPLWFALIDWLRPGGTRPSRRVILGIMVGFAGVVTLIQGGKAGYPNSQDPWGAAAVLFAGLAWASGSLYARHTPKPASPLMGVALQMIMGGLVLTLGGTLLGETRDFEWSKVSSNSSIAFVYLTLVGSLVGFTAFSWLLKVASPSKVSTYAYVNPVIAVFLGWAIAREPITLRIVWGAAIILVGVMILLLRRSNTGANVGAAAQDSGIAGTPETAAVGSSHRR